MGHAGMETLSYYFTLPTSPELDKISTAILAAEKRVGAWWYYLGEHGIGIHKAEFLAWELGRPD